MSLLSRRLRPTKAAGSLTVTEVDVLMAVQHRGQARLSDIATFAGLNPTMLSRVVAKLEAAGLIRRLGDIADRRVCRVEVTASGTRLLKRARSERNGALCELVRGLGPAERQVVLDAVPVLEDMAESLWVSSHR
jgi:DNA-binding MarR family transcriptional regulator